MEESQKYSKKTVRGRKESSENNFKKIKKKDCFLGNLKLTYEKKIDCVQLAEILIFAFV